MNSTHPKWRPLRITDEESIIYLNRMFQQGWYIPEFGIDDIAHFVIEVPAETPKRINYSNEHQILQAKKMPSITVVVVHKGKKRNHQLAVIDVRDQSGYRIKSSDWPDRRLWKLISHFSLDNGSGVHIFEQRT